LSAATTLDSYTISQSIKSQLKSCLKVNGFIFNLHEPRNFTTFSKHDIEDGGRFSESLDLTFNGKKYSLSSDEHVCSPHETFSHYKTISITSKNQGRFRLFASNLKISTIELKDFIRNIKTTIRNRPESLNEVFEEIVGKRSLESLDRTFRSLPATSGGATAGAGSSLTPGLGEATAGAGISLTPGSKMVARDHLPDTRTRFSPTTAGDRGIPVVRENPLLGPAKKP